MREREIGGQVKQGCEFTGTHACGRKLEDNLRYPSLDTSRVSRGWELAELTRLSGQHTQGSTCRHFPSTEITSAYHHAWIVF